jgi:hypothetical protein
MSRFLSDGARLQDKTSRIMPARAQESALFSSAAREADATQFGILSPEIDYAICRTK